MYFAPLSKTNWSKNGEICINYSYGNFNNWPNLGNFLSRYI